MDKSRSNLGEADQGKTVAIVSYLTIIGLVAALVMNNSNPTSLGRFHIRQSIGITAAALFLGCVSFIPGIGEILGKVVGIIVLFVVVLGILGAVNKQEKGIPVVGPLFQKWFSMI
ncbi:hypothetical protein ORI89_06970 [Sphingobacterium sp. UT-1RO-CII-1]|uniref:DUF4870 domain-containing protein n=1 Tax=Sphingobacterium sp. UT-1RO-CII-1 TaxID=2995225 RepID=UPI00227BF7B6|nr:hypothetical protein [Sphingobacterium sp. UT-1RO-CII-1]MCY4779385.1 hypothetical protein [Sphingobacterium sp. UT-1RO-CII-1]